MEEDKNYISLIHGDLTRATQVQHGMPGSSDASSIVRLAVLILITPMLSGIPCAVGQFLV